jgi:acyl carrier protein
MASPSAAEVRHLVEDGRIEMSEFEEVSEKLVLAWSQVLGKAATPQTDFFASQGDSLAALELASIIEASIGQEVSLKMIFDAPTPAEMAQTLVSAAG